MKVLLSEYFLLNEGVIRALMIVNYYSTSVKAR